MEYKDIKSIVPNPASAIDAFLDGMLDTKDDKDFEIYMNTFGEVSDGICYGCAATCALQKITGKKLSGVGKHYTGLNSVMIVMRADYFNLCEEELRTFELGIDCARLGMFQPLFEFYNAGYGGKYEDLNLRMEDHNWEEKIPAFRKIAKQMRIDNHGLE